MTMPHLENCQHLDGGWCGDCVKTEWDRIFAIIEAAEAEVARLSDELEEWKALHKLDFAQSLYWQNCAEVFKAEC